MDFDISFVSDWQ